MWVVTETPKPIIPKLTTLLQQEVSSLRVITLLQQEVSSLSNRKFLAMVHALMNEFAKQARRTPSAAADLVLQSHNHRCQ